MKNPSLVADVDQKLSSHGPTLIRQYKIANIHKKGAPAGPSSGLQTQTYGVEQHVWVYFEEVWVTPPILRNSSVISFGSLINSVADSMTRKSLDTRGKLLIELYWQPLTQVYCLKSLKCLSSTLEHWFFPEHFHVLSHTDDETVVCTAFGLLNVECQVTFAPLCIHKCIFNERINDCAAASLTLLKFKHCYLRQRRRQTCYVSYSVFFLASYPPSIGPVCRE
jgi:hypothetical protein